MTQSVSSLHATLIHQIYAVVHQPDAWSAMWQTLDAMRAQNHLDNQQMPELLPHLMQAQILIDEMGRIQLSHQHRESILDNMPMGIIQISRNGKILSANKRGLSILKHVQGDSDSSHLHFDNPKHQSTFVAATRAVCCGELESKSLRIAHLKLHITGQGNGQLNVFLSEHTHHQPISADRLQKMYGLTKQEARLCCELVSGTVNMEDAATTMGIRISTARSHLKRIFFKTNTGNQAELIKMILLNPALTMHTDKSSRAETKKRHSQFIRLPSGRTISWAEYGDAKGRPLLFCHAITGCRLMIPENESMLHRQRIRLIVPDRAGYGQSTATKKPVMEQWLEDVRLFLAELSIGRCSLIGHSAGAAHAMELAAAYPEQIEHLYLISGIAPIEHDRDLEQLLPLSRMLIRLCRSHVPLSREILKLSLKMIIKRPESYFEQVKADLPDADIQAMAHRNLQAQLTKAFAETRRQGVDHLVEECLMTANHWHIEASQITCPVTTWHGTADRHAPVTMMDRFEQGLPALANRHRIDGTGHYLLFSYWDDIIKDIANFRVCVESITVA